MNLLLRSQAVMDAPCSSLAVSALLGFIPLRELEKSSRSAGQESVVWRVLQEPTCPAYSHAMVIVSEAGPCSTQCHLLQQLQQLWCEGGIDVWCLSPCFSWCLVGADSFL